MAKNFKRINKSRQEPQQTNITEKPDNGILARDELDALMKIRPSEFFGKKSQPAPMTEKEEFDALMQPRPEVTLTGDSQQDPVIEKALSELDETEQDFSGQIQEDAVKLAEPRPNVDAWKQTPEPEQDGNRFAEAELPPMPESMQQEHAFIKKVVDALEEQHPEGVDDAPKQEEPRKEESTPEQESGGVDVSEHQLLLHKMKRKLYNNKKLLYAVISKQEEASILKNYSLMKFGRMQPMEILINSVKEL